MLNGRPAVIRKSLFGARATRPLSGRDDFSPSHPRTPIPTPLPLRQLDAPAKMSSYAASYALETGKTDCFVNAGLSNHGTVALAMPWSRTAPPGITTALSTATPPMFVYRG